MIKVRTHGTATDTEWDIHLIEWTCGGRTEYSTHLSNAETPDSLYGGHYFTTLECARADFIERVTRAFQ